MDRFQERRKTGMQRRTSLAQVPILRSSPRSESIIGVLGEHDLGGSLEDTQGDGKVPQHLPNI